MNTLINLARKIRSVIMKGLFPKSGYFLFPASGRSVAPLSGKSGFDRGTPVDRYYIESFLDENKSLIKGRCLEIHDDAYTVKYGGDKVTVRDVLDIDAGNKLANLHGDLRNLSNVPSETYDTLIITQTIGMIDDVFAAVKELHRILKPGGTLLLTASALAPYLDNGGYWRFTVNSFKYLLDKHFDPSRTEIKSLGNALAGQAFWVGAAQEEMTQEELKPVDERFPVVIAGKTTK